MYALRSPSKWTSFKAIQSYSSMANTVRLDLLSSGPKDDSTINVNSEARLQTGMELEFLGTSSAQSTNTRNVSSLALHYQGGTLLFDCGEGTCRQFIRSRVKPSQIEAVFITHLHGDHIYGLPGLGMRTLGLRDVENPIRLFAPRGIAKMFSMTLSRFKHFCINELVPPAHHRGSNMRMITRQLGKETTLSAKDGNLCVNSINYDHDTVRGYKVYENNQLSVFAAPIKHSIFCLGYVVVEKPTRGALQMEKLQRDHGKPQLKPGAYLKLFETEEFVSLPTGTTVRSSEYMDPPRPGRRIVILGDTCDPMGIAHLAKDADVLVHEATNSDAEKTIALSYCHSTAGMAGDYARKINAKSLILTHFSPRNLHANEYEECSHIRTLLEQARNTFGSASVYAASDFWRYPIPQRKAVSQSERHTT